MAEPARSRQVRLTVVLDTRVTLEALLVTALRKNPTTRRQEWLRRLLLAGFRSECLGLRHAMNDLPVLASARFSSTPIAGSRDAGQELPGPTAPSEIQVNIASQTGKPLAGLRQLIG